MRFPSIRNLAQGAAHVIKRFPLEVLFALVGTIAGTINIELNTINYPGQSWCWRITAGANLGLLLSLSATLYSESRQWPAARKWLLRLAAAIITAGIVASISPFERSTDAIRFFLLSFAFHLLVAFAAFIEQGMVQGFWQFNKTLFLRFLTSVLYSAVLFLGLAAAIGAVNFLFNFKFEWDTYAVLWVWIVGMFSVIFFLAGVPSNFEVLNNDESYPKGLKIFTQYVLIPLATVYVLILLAYEVKIAIQWHLPKGLVSSLILSYAVFGILSILLVYPIRNHEDSKWIKTYAKSFYLLLLPLIVLLFVATGARVFKYGVTEFRYFLIVLAFWLLFISVYFLISARQNIKLIPISLCILTLLAIYGPQSAFSVSKSSQRSILKNIFERNHAFKDGALQPVNDKISKKDGNRAVSIIKYLVEHHDLTSLQPYFKRDLQQVADSLSHLKSKNRGDGMVSRYEVRANKTEWVKKQLELEEFSGYWRDDEEATEIEMEKIITLNSEYSEVIETRGYDYVINVNMANLADTLSSDTLTYQLPQGKIQHFQRFNDKQNIKIDEQTVTFDLRAWAGTIMSKTKELERYRDTANYNKYANAYTLPVKVMTLTQTVGTHTVTLKISNATLTLQKKNGQPDITYTSGAFLIKW